MENFEYFTLRAKLASFNVAQISPNTTPKFSKSPYRDKRFDIITAGFFAL
jgi:hypothetical protein